MYTPNIKDPRTQKRVKRAIAFTNAFLSEDKPRGWSTRYIDKFFGQQQNELSKWLRSKLLICVNERYTMGEKHCKEYIKNPSGIIELVSLLDKPTYTPSVLQVTKDFIHEEFGEELKSKNFIYEDKSNRLWHDLQRIKREIKSDILFESGLTHSYDIECCAPTLIHQYSQTIPEIIHEGKYIQGPMDLYLFALRRYLKERKQVRTQLANEAEITYDQAKEVINALLMGAQLGMNYKSDIYKLLNGDKARIEFLKQHEYITQLREDIKTCWEYIRPTLPVTYITDKNKKQRRLGVSGKQKAGVYFDLERKVLNSIRDFLDKTNNKYFLEHDGFSCEMGINKEELTQWVYNNTGYMIQLDHKDKPTHTPSVLQVRL